MSQFNLYDRIAGISWLISEEDVKRYFWIKSKEQEQEPEQEPAWTIIDDVGGGIVTVDQLIEGLVNDAKSGTGRVYLVKATAGLDNSAFGFYLSRELLRRLGSGSGSEDVRLIAAMWHFNARYPNGPGNLVIMDDHIMGNPELEIAEVMKRVLEMVNEDGDEKDWSWGFHYPLVITTSGEAWDGVIKILFGNDIDAITSEEHRQLFRTLYNEGKVIRRLTLLKKPETKWLYG